MITEDAERILYLSRNDVERACREIDSVAIIREAFKMHASEQTVLPDEAYLGWTNRLGETVRSLNMPGYIAGSFGVAGTKIINGNIANPLRGLPRASGLTLLYDDCSVQVTCIMEGAYLSSLRTACVSALAIDLLANSDPDCLAIIGAGVLSRTHVELLVKRLPQLHTIQIFEIDSRRIPGWIHAISDLLHAHDVTLQIASSPEAAIRCAQVIIPATTVTAGYIAFNWLQPGSVLINVSLDDPLPEVVLNVDQIVVDDWNLVCHDNRRLLGRMYREGLILGPYEEADPARTNPNARRINAQLGEILNGTRPGRQHVDETILVNPFGLSIEDISLAAYVYEQARRLGIGIWLDR